MTAKKSKANKTTTPSLSGATTEKRRRRRKKKVIRAEITSLDDFDILENEQIETAIKEQLSKFVKKRKLDRKTVENLTTVIQEFLSCFILLGYNFQGEPMTIVSVENQQQADSLGTMLHRFVMNSSQFSGPAGPPPGA